MYSYFTSNSNNSHEKQILTTFYMKLCCQTMNCTAKASKYTAMHLNWEKLPA